MTSERRVHEEKIHRYSVFMFYVKSLCLDAENQKGQREAVSSQRAPSRAAMAPREQGPVHLTPLPPRTGRTPYTATRIEEFQRGTKAHSTISDTCWQWRCSGCSKVDQVLLQIEREIFSQYLGHKHHRRCMIVGWLKPWKIKLGLKSDTKNSSRPN